ncbi:MAG: S9 family peptidase, partial [Chloroflexota bacterium]
DSTRLAFAAGVSTDPDEQKAVESKDEKKPQPTMVIERAGYKADGAGYTGNRRQHLFVIDLSTREIDQRTEGDCNNDKPAWSPDSRHIAFRTNRLPRWDVSLESDIYLIPAEGGEARRLTSGGAFTTPIFSPDGERVAFTGAADPEMQFGTPDRIYSVARSGEDLRDELGEWDGHVGNWVIGDVVQPDEMLCNTWTQTGISFLGTERGEANVYRCNGQTVHAVTTGAHDVTGFSFSQGGALAYTRADSADLAEVYVKRGEATEQLTRENQSFLSEVWIGRPERFSYRGANGEAGEARLLAPRGAATGKHPLLVYIHGGPEFAYGESLFFEYQYLAGQGFGVLFPNIHGSASYGSRYMGSILKDWGNLDYQDVLAVTREGMARPWVDGERLGILGGSYGGYMTLWTMGHTDLFRAGMAERCVSNFVSFMGTSDGGWMWNRIMGAYPEENVQKLWDMSPLKYIAAVTSPLMLMHSENDDRTPIEQGEQAFLALRRLGVETRFVRFPEESHGLSRMGKPSRRVERLELILEWFRRWL